MASLNQRNQEECRMKTGNSSTEKTLTQEKRALCGNQKKHQQQVEHSSNMVSSLTADFNENRNTQSPFTDTLVVEGDLSREVNYQVHASQPGPYFPDEILLIIFGYLAPIDLIRVSLVCWQWCNVSEDYSVWSPYLNEPVNNKNKLSRKLFYGNPAFRAIEYRDSDKLGQGYRQLEQKAASGKWNDKKKRKYWQVLVFLAKGKTLTKSHTQIVLSQSNSVLSHRVAEALVTLREGNIDSEAIHKAILECDSTYGVREYAAACVELHREGILIEPIWPALLKKDAIKVECYTEAFVELHREGILIEPIWSALLEKKSTEAMFYVEALTRLHQAGIELNKFIWIPILKLEYAKLGSYTKALIKLHQGRALDEPTRDFILSYDRYDVVYIYSIAFVGMHQQGLVIDDFIRNAISSCDSKAAYVLADGFVILHQYDLDEYRHELLQWKTKKDLQRIYNGLVRLKKANSLNQRCVETLFSLSPAEVFKYSWMQGHILKYQRAYPGYDQQTQRLAELLFFLYCHKIDDEEIRQALEANITTTDFIKVADAVEFLIESIINDKLIYKDNGKDLAVIVAKNPDYSQPLANLFLWVLQKDLLTDAVQKAVAEAVAYSSHTINYLSAMEEELLDSLTSDNLVSIIKNLSDIALSVLGKLEGSHLYTQSNVNVLISYPKHAEAIVGGLFMIAESNQKENSKLFNGEYATSLTELFTVLEEANFAYNLMPLYQNPQSIPAFTKAIKILKTATTRKHLFEKEYVDFLLEDPNDALSKAVILSEIDQCINTAFGEYCCYGDQEDKKRAREKFEKIILGQVQLFFIEGGPQPITELTQESLEQLFVAFEMALFSHVIEDAIIPSLFKQGHRLLSKGKESKYSQVLDTLASIREAMESKDNFDLKYSSIDANLAQKTQQIASIIETNIVANKAMERHHFIVRAGLFVLNVLWGLTIILPLLKWCFTRIKNGKGVAMIAPDTRSVKEGKQQIQSLLSVSKLFQTKPPSCRITAEARTVRYNVLCSPIPG